MRFYKDGPSGDKLRSCWLLPAGPVGWEGAALGPGGFTRGCWTRPTQGFTPLAFFSSGGFAVSVGKSASWSREEISPLGPGDPSSGSASASLSL